MKKMACVMITVMSIALSAGSLPASANLIVNGGFESPTVPPGSFNNNFAVGTAGLTGWSVVGPGGRSVSIISGSHIALGIPVPADTGVQWLDLTGPGSNNPEGVSQTVITTIGQAYELSYSIGNLWHPSGVFGVTSTVNVLVNGLLAFSDTNSTITPTTINWMAISHTFTATTPTTTLTFLNGDPFGENGNGDGNNGLDSIVLTAVSEPPSSMIFLIGFLGSLLLLRTHNRRGWFGPTGMMWR